MSLLNFSRDFPGERQIRLLLGDSLISQARNRLTADFLESDCTHCLFVDCDQLFTSRDVERILSHNESIVGGLIAAKIPGEPTIEFDLLPDRPPINERGLLPVAHIGAGFLLIARRVFEKMLMEYGEEIKYHNYATGRDEHDFWKVGIFRFASGHGYYYGEDWHLCQRATDLGFTLFCDTKVILRHIGTIYYPAREINLELATAFL